MTSGMAEAVIIVLLFGLFYSLKIVLTIIGLAIQSGRNIPKQVKVQNAISLILLLSSWLLFVVVVFVPSDEVTSEAQNQVVLNYLTYLMLAFNIGAAILLVSGLKRVGDGLKKSARSLWLISLLLLAINIVIITTKAVIADAREFDGLGGIFFVETLFFILFFVCICRFPKKLKN